MTASTPSPTPRPPRPASTVSLPRWVVGLLVGACVVCLAAVAFLLGRVTAPAPPAPSTRVEAARPTEGPDDGGAAQPLASVPSPAAEAHLAGASPDAAAVAAYFSQMDAVGAESKAGQDPQTLARNVLEQTIAGNTGAIEGLIATQRSLEMRMKQVQPPPACREHHQRSVRLFGRAIALLERTRDAIAGQGLSDIGSVAAEGRAIEQEARAVDALANDLRRAAGLAPVP